MRKKCFSLVVFLMIFGFLGLLKAEAVETERKKVVMMDFGVKLNALQIGSEFSEVTGTEKISNLFTTELIAVLEKDSLLEVLEGMRNDNLQKGVEKGKGSGADYLVMGSIERMELQKKKSDVTATGKVVDELFGHLVVNLRVVDVHTAKVIYAEKVGQLETECINEHSKTKPSLFSAMLKEKMVKQLAIRITETIWPIKISKLYGGYAYLDRGQGANLQRGMRLGVFIPMRPVTDASTGEVVSDTEYMIAELKVTEVLPKVTKTQIVKYSMPVESGYICRMIMKSDNKNCQ